MFSWSFALTMALLLGFNESLNGFYYARESMDDTAICWIKSSEGHGLNYRTFVFLYIPLFFAFFASAGVLVLSYYWLRQGVSKTFQHRVKAFLANLINLLVYFSYWLANLIFFILVFTNLESEDYNISRPAYKLLFFGISSKGFANLMVWILVSDNWFFREGRGERNRKSVASARSTIEDGFDFNVVLREEVLYYVTTGIRMSTERSTLCKETVRKIAFRMTKRASDRAQRFNTGYLLQLLFTQATDTVVARLSTLSDKPRTMTKNSSSNSLKKRNKGDESGGVLNSPLMDDLEQNRSENSMDSRDSGPPSVDRSSSFSVVMSPSGQVSFTGITDSRASFTEYDVSAIDEDGPEDPARRKGGRLQGIITNLLHSGAIRSPHGRSVSGQSTSKDKTNVLPVLEEHPYETGTVESKNQQVQVTMEEQSDGTQRGYSVVQMLNERFPWLSGDNNATKQDTAHARKVSDRGNSAAVIFTGYDPFQFYRIRKASGIEEKDFIEAFSETVKERLQDGGASGAFFFFSKGERFIAKSCSEAELLNIRRNIYTYANYFELNPMSCIARVKCPKSC